MEAQNSSGDERNARYSESDINFNRQLMETDRAFKLMSLKNNVLDSHKEELRKELYDKEDESQEAYKNLLAAEEEAETAKTVLLSLRQSARVEVKRGEDLKRKIEEENVLLETLQTKEREVIEKFEEDSLKLIEKTRENHKVNSTHEMDATVYAMKQKVQDSHQERQKLRQRVEELKGQAEEIRENREHEGLNQVVQQLTPIPKEDLDTERKYTSALVTLMRLDKKKRDHTFEHV